jgi:serine/threonine protein kinase
VPIEAGQQLLHYRLIEKIGEGGMGVVWKAEDTKLHRHIALKILPEAMAADPDRRARFEREARAVAALNHPNIVTLHSVEEADTPAGTVHFITMELVEGRNLTELPDRASSERRLPATAFA